MACIFSERPMMEPRSTLRLIARRRFWRSSSLRRRLMPAATVVDDLLVLEGLADAAEGAALPRADGRVEGGVGGDDDDDGLGVGLQNLFERAQAAHAGHRDVEEHHVVGAPAVSLQALFAGLRQIDAIPFRREQRLQHVAHDLLVVHDEDGTFSRHPNLCNGCRVLGVGFWGKRTRAALLHLKTNTQHPTPILPRRRRGGERRGAYLTEAESLGLSRRRPSGVATGRARSAVTKSV